MMWLAPPVSVLTGRAMYTPETAVEGTAQLAETAQFPQSTNPVDCIAHEVGLNLWQAYRRIDRRYFARSTTAVITKSINIDVVGRRIGVDFEADRLIRDSR